MLVDIYANKNNASIAVTDGYLILPVFNWGGFASSPYLSLFPYIHGKNNKQATTHTEYLNKFSNNKEKYEYNLYLDYIKKDDIEPDKNIYDLSEKAKHIELKLPFIFPMFLNNGIQNSIFNSTVDFFSNHSNNYYRKPFFKTYNPDANTIFNSNSYQDSTFANTKQINHNMQYCIINGDLLQQYLEVFDTMLYMYSCYGDAFLNKFYLKTDRSNWDDQNPILYPDDYNRNDGITTKPYLNTGKEFNLMLSRSNFKGEILTKMVVSDKLKIHFDNLKLISMATPGNDYIIITYNAIIDIHYCYNLTGHSEYPTFNAYTLDFIMYVDEILIEIDDWKLDFDLKSEWISYVLNLLTEAPWDHYLINVPMITKFRLIDNRLALVDAACPIQTIINAETRVEQIPGINDMMFIRAPFRMMYSYHSHHDKLKPIYSNGKSSSVYDAKNDNIVMAMWLNNSADTEYKFDTIDADDPYDLTGFIGVILATYSANDSFERKNPSLFKIEVIYVDPIKDMTLIYHNEHLYLSYVDKWNMFYVVKLTYLNNGQYDVSPSFIKSDVLDFDVIGVKNGKLG